MLFISSFMSDGIPDFPSRFPRTKRIISQAVKWFAHTLSRVENTIPREGTLPAVTLNSYLGGSSLTAGRGRNTLFFSWLS